MTIITTSVGPLGKFIDHHSLKHIRLPRLISRMAYWPKEVQAHIAYLIVYVVESVSPEHVQSVSWNQETPNGHP